jgi:hypothetical protein
MGVTINDIWYAVITVVVPLVLPFIFDLISAKVADWRYAAALGDVFSAVEYVNQTFTDALKEKGCFDEEAQAYAFTMAKEAALTLMANRTRKWLEKSVTDLDSWLTMQIEAAVRSAKPEKGVA